MRALSIRQPWAWAILHAGKRVENRSWNTRVRGPFLIHVGRSCPKWEYEEAVHWMVRCAFARSPLFQLDTVSEIAARAVGIDPDMLPEVPALADLPRGGIIGQANLVDVLEPTVRVRRAKREVMASLNAPTTPRVGPRAPWHEPYSFGFVLADVEQLPLHPLSGVLGFFDSDAPQLRVTLAEAP